MADALHVFHVLRNSVLRGGNQSMSLLAVENHMAFFRPGLGYLLSSVTVRNSHSPAWIQGEGTEVASL